MSPRQARRFVEGDLVWTAVASDKILCRVRILTVIPYAGTVQYVVVIRDEPDPVLAIRPHGTVYVDAGGLDGRGSA